MPNFERFRSAGEALKEFEAETAIMHQAWCALDWIYCELSPDRLTYLRNLDKLHVGTIAGSKEMKKLEKVR